MYFFVFLLLELSHHQALSFTLLLKIDHEFFDFSLLVYVLLDDDLSVLRLGLFGEKVQLDGEVVELA